MAQTFEIFASKTKELTKIYVANSRAEAVTAFLKKHPTYVVNEVDGEGVLGLDEYTREPIFVGDDYVSDSEGVMFLKKNVPDEELESTQDSE